MIRILTLFFCALPFALVAQNEIQLAGSSQAHLPFYKYHQSYNWSDPIEIGIDPNQVPIAGQNVDVYICADQDAMEWNAEGSLADVRSTGAQTVMFTGSSIQEAVIALTNTDDLLAETGARPGASYDVVIDVDQDGILGPDDYIDGLEEAGFYLIRDMFEQGPYDVDTAFHSSSFWNTFRVYYPTNIQELGEQPLVVVSHGWTHEYWYYDYIGYHLASYGYVVMAHRNDVGNGGALATETASQTALENIDEFFTVQDELANGLLSGKVNKNLIVHTGHSTGGECVVRAYKRLFDGDYESPHITHENIVLVSSIAPVAFLDATLTNPEGANYHQFLGAADTDVSGFCADNYYQHFSIYERGYGNKQITYIHGVGHEDLHDEPGNPLASGPDLIGKEATHSVVKPYFLALCELYTHNNLAMKEFFTRNRNEFRPASIDPAIVISGEYRDAENQNLVIDDFEMYPDEHLSSSGAAVSWDFDEYIEVEMRDMDESFEWDGNQWSNGLTRARFDDDPHCVVFEWEENNTLEFGLNPESVIWESFEFLSFRMAQLTRHPLNEAHDALTFSIQVEDASENSATVSSANYGSLLPPYPRGNGGYLELCLEEGTYTIECGGSQWESEMSFTIPNYIENAGAGTYEIEIGPGDPCTEIEVLMFDTWGDGWDAGTVKFFNSDGVLVAEGTMNTGSVPDPGFGWQNEFYTYRVNLADFLLDNPQLDLSNMLNIKFLFGPDHGSSTGAVAFDDLELAEGGLSFVANIDEESTPDHSLLIYPNPADDGFYIAPQNISGLWSLDIFDSQGKQVLTQSGIRQMSVFTSTQSLPAGIYIVRIQTKSTIISSRLIVR